VRPALSPAGSRPGPGAEPALGLVDL
jgi:hypothetical protein